MMNYYELRFTYQSPIETEILNDVLAAELGEIGFESFDLRVQILNFQPQTTQFKLYAVLGVHFLCKKPVCKKHKVTHNSNA